MKKVFEQDFRSRLIRVAQAEAKRNFHGNTSAGIANLQPLQAYFIGEDGMTEHGWDTDWGGAFVYHCLRLCGVEIPPHYPDTRVHSCFACAGAWWQYARLPKIRLWHNMAEEPQPGDLVFFQTGEGKPGMVGILLEAFEDSLTLAVGNYHNHSAIVERPRNELLLGWMQLFK